MLKVTFPNDEAGRRELIKARLRLAGYTLGGLSRELGLSRTAVSVALWQPYPKMERIIAEKLGVKPAELWPERYQEHGKPRRRAQRAMHVEQPSTPPEQAGESGPDASDEADR